MEPLNMKELIYKDRDGKIIKNPEEYFAALNKNVLVKEKLQVGDIVKLRNYEGRVKIVHVDFETGIGIMDYAGEDPNDEKGVLTLFNQKDIESYERAGIEED